MFGLFDIAVGGQITEFVMPFREKISWLSLGGIAVAFGPYFYMVLVRNDVPASLWPVNAALLLGTVIVLTCVMTVATIIVALSNVRDAQAPSDERDQTISRRAVAFAYPVLLAAVFLALGTLFFGANQATLINVVLGAIVLGEMTRCVAEIVGYRTRG
jgi:hypothetical protein